jgi:hypothetical protein
MARTNQTASHARMDAPSQVQALNAFDYGAPAELFVANPRKSKRKVTYRRFGTAAEALRFAVEEVAAPALVSAYLEVDEARFGPQDIHSLYADPAYPLARAARGG